MWQRSLVCVLHDLKRWRQVFSWQSSYFVHMPPFVCIMWFKRRGGTKASFPAYDLSRDMTKPTKWVCAQRRLRSVWSESSLCAQWVAKDPSFLHADSDDSDQTGWMPRLIWVFAGRTIILLVLSWGGSFIVFDFHCTDLLLTFYSGIEHFLSCFTQKGKGCNFHRCGICDCYVSLF